MDEPATPVSASAEHAARPGFVYIRGEPHSLDSESGALSIVHGVLQSAIGSVEDALELEQAYLRELDKRRLRWSGK